MAAQVGLQRFRSRLEEHVKQVGARDDANGALVTVLGRLRQDGDLPPAIDGHQLLHALDGVGRPHDDRAGAHDAADRLAAHLQAHRPIHSPPRHQPDDAPLSLIDYGVALVAMLLHQSGHITDASRRRHGQDAMGHKRGHARRRLHGAGQQLAHALQHLRQLPADDHCRRRPAVAAATQLAGHQTDIDLIDRAAGDDLHAVADAHQHKEAIGRQRLAQTVGDGRNLVVEAARGNGRGQSNGPLLDALPLEVMQQEVI